MVKSSRVLSWVAASAMLSMAMSVTGCDDAGAGVDDAAAPGEAQGGGKADDAQGESLRCDAIALPGDSLFPEGIAASRDGTFYFSSFTTGGILQSKGCDPEHAESLLAPRRDPNNTIATVGLLVDDANDLVWACRSDFSGATYAAVIGVSRADGAVKYTHELGPGTFCNDLTFDDAGNLYATDSFVGEIFRIEASRLLSDAIGWIWSWSPDYGVDPGQFGLNGIAFHEGAIYSVHYQDGLLYRIDIADDGQAKDPEVVAFEGGLRLAGPDGLKVTDDGDLLVVQGQSGSISRITLGGPRGATLEDVARGLDVPTTTVLVDGAAWVIEGQLDHFLDPNAGPADPFQAVRIDLD